MQFGILNSNGFLKHLLAYGASEAASKLSRLFVVVVIARSLDADQVGLAAAALGFCEIIKALTENGINQRIMAAPLSELRGICAQAYRLFWGWCLFLMVAQLGLAVVLWAFDQDVIAVLVAVAALEYLFMPGGLVQAALAMREGKLSQTAAIAGTQIVSANVLAVGLALVFASPLALVLPRVLTAPFWLIAMRRLRPWRIDCTVPKAAVRPFITYGLPVLGIEMVKALRLHADKLIVGAILGPEALGIYFMAFNAGLSLSTSFVAAFEKVVFPHLCQRQSDKSQRVAGGSDLARMGLFLIAPVVIAQALLAPFYVPLLLGDGWTGIEPVVSVLCLCALPLTLWTVSAAQLRLAGKPRIELLVTLTLTVGLMLGAVIFAPYGLLTMAIAYLATHVAVLGAACLFTQRPSNRFTQQEV